MDYTVKKLKSKIIIADVIIAELKSLKHNGVDTNIVNDTIIGSLVDDIYDILSDGDINEINIRLTAHNKIVEYILRTIPSESIDTRTIVGVRDLRTVLTKLVWDKFSKNMIIGVKKLLDEKYYNYYNILKNTYTFNYEEEVYHTYSATRIMTEYIVNMFMLETLSKNDMKIVYPFVTAHIVQDNITKYCNEIIDLIHSSCVNIDVENS
jgi:hypothetical protein